MATSTFTIGDPTSPISIAGTDGADERRFFGFGVPSRLIRIIVRQSSSGPSPQPPPSGRHYHRSIPLPLPLPAPQSFETDSEFPPAAQTPGATPPVIPALSMTHPQRRSSRCARLPRSHGRNQMSSEFPTQ